MGTLDKIESIGVLGLIAAAAYLLYTRWDNITSSLCKLPFAREFFGEEMCPNIEQNCPAGSWENTAGTCCPDNTNTYEGGICINRIPRTQDEHGCWTDIQHWCATDNQCRDNAQACTPSTGCEPCYEWSPTFAKCLYSPTKCPPEPCKKTKACDDGSYVCPENACPPWTQPHRDMQCICGNQVFTLTAAEEAAYQGCGDYCDKVHPIDCDGVQRCPVTGAFVDLCNPPGITLEQACKGSIQQPCQVTMWDALKQCGQTTPGMIWSTDQHSCETQGGSSCYPVKTGYGNQAYVNYTKCLDIACGW
jgi:hypothetical protein